MTAHDTSGFWSGPDFRIQQCDDCKLYIHPPASVCYRCDGRSLEFQPVSGTGTLYSWTRVHRPAPPRLGDAPSYLVAQVELDEQPGLFAFANLPTVRNASELTVGMALVAITRATEDELPDFEPASERGDS